MLNDLRVLSHSQEPHALGTNVTPILQVRQSSLKEVNRLVQVQRAGAQVIWCQSQKAFDYDFTHL